MSEQKPPKNIEEPREEYAPPRLIELDKVSKVTLGKYAEDSADQGRYFE